jgi:hypothetical protein
VLRIVRGRLELMSTKFFCKACRIYIDNNKAQRFQHESGARHKAALEKARQLAREQKLEVAANEKKLAQTLQSIAQAARKDLDLDKELSPPTDAASGQPFIAAIHTSHSRGFSGNVVIQIDDQGGTDSRDDGNEEEGIYEEKGVFYMQGEKHLDKLQPGTLCELYVEDLKKWVPASLSLRHESKIPNDSANTTFDVTYFPQAGEGSDPVPPGWCDNVKPQELRLVYDKPVPSSTLSIGEGASNKEESKLPLPDKDESTGLGKWESVLDEPKEGSGINGEGDERQRMEHVKKGSKREYKGISLQTTRSLQNDSLAEGKMTKFKKRRKKE